MAVSNEWLEKINQEFRNAGMPPQQRPWEAVKRYSIEFRAKFTLSSAIATEIFEWFEAHSKEGAHDIGILYESVYYFDCAFWVVKIPVVYGKARLEAPECLQGMPEPLKKEITSTPRHAWGYGIFWADCLDYGFGLDELSRKRDLDHFGLELLMAADQELRAAVSQLKETRPDSRVILTCRMATEIFLKAYIALKAGLTDAQAKELGHNLQAALDRVVEISGRADLVKLRSMLDVFPPVRERYAEQSLPLNAVWNGFALAQFFGAFVVRDISGRNTLAQMGWADSAPQVSGM